MNPNFYYITISRIDNQKSTECRNGKQRRGISFNFNESRFDLNPALKTSSPKLNFKNKEDNAKLIVALSACIAIEPIYAFD
jgi:hypothetical protein